MSEQSMGATAVAVAPSAEDRAARRKQAEQVLAEILERMEWPARLELKDAEDGGISVALHSEVDVAGVQPGKRSFLVDSLQLVLNKIINKPPAERRWVAIGVGDHPPPRNAEKPPDRPAKKPAAVAPGGAPPPKPPVPRSSPAAPETDERTMAVAPDPDLVSAAKKLAARSAAVGRYYAIVGMKREERASVVQAAAETPGCSVSIEGEGRQRRVVFTPAKPAPMPKKAFPLDDDDEDLGDD